MDPKEEQRKLMRNTASFSQATPGGRSYRSRPPHNATPRSGRRRRETSPKALTPHPKKRRGRPGRSLKQKTEPERAVTPEKALGNVGWLLQSFCMRQNSISLRENGSASSGSGEDLSRLLLPASIKGASCGQRTSIRNASPGRKRTSMNTQSASHYERRREP